MSVGTIEKELMNYVRGFNTANCKKDNSGYAEKYIGFKDDVLWVYGHKVKKEDFLNYSGRC